MPTDNHEKGASGGAAEEFFESPVTGYLALSPEGVVVRANGTLARWLERRPDELVGEKFSNLLAVAGKVFLQTHLAPLLRMQGFYDEIALEFALRSGQRFPVLANAFEQRDGDGGVVAVHMAFFKGRDRQKYERSLVEARKGAQEHLDEERTEAALREQFIAVLGHDLRNPLAAIAAGMRLLARRRIDDESAELTALILRSVSRMTGLIDNLMDFAFGRLGGGIALQLAHADLAPALRHVVEELQIHHPNQQIEVDLDLPALVVSDPSRLAQLLSNLLANALVHGASDAPVKVRALVEGGDLVLSVTNSGEPIPEEVLPRLFAPFTRNDDRPSKQGLGLGLYIASQIADAHGGTLQARSTPVETTFAFRMPVAPSDSSPTVQ